jgi:competence protein ComFB
LSYPLLPYMISKGIKQNEAKTSMTQPCLLNVTEEIVTGLVNFMLHSPDYQTFCHCKKCELDIIAIALNSLPSKYVVSEESRTEAYKKVNTPDNIEHINKQIIRAFHVVSKNPKH